MNGLTVKNGRLVNERPDGMTGIQQAANMKRIITEDRKIKMIADGIERAESMLMDDKVATATFSVSGTVGCTLNLNQTSCNYLYSVVLLLLVLILCRKCVG